MKRLFSGIKQNPKASTILSTLTGKWMFITTCFFALIAAIGMLGSDSNHSELEPLTVLYKIERPEKSKPAKSHNLTRSAFTLLKNTPRGEAGELLSVSDYETHSIYGPMPENISDLEIDGGFETDADGNLIISHDNKLLFDFFLSVANIEGKDLCAERIREYILLTLPEKAGDQALDLFESYLAYKGKLNDFYQETQEINRYVSSPDQLSILKNTLEQTISFRREVLGDKVADAFFGDEEAISDYTITSMDILTSSNISESEKKTMREEAKNVLPESIRKDMAEYEEEQEFDRTIAELKTNTKNRDHIFALRAQRYGKQAAERLEALDNGRNMLRERYHSFCREVRENPDYSHLSETELTEKINELKKSEFKEWELASLTSFNHETNNL